MRPKVKFGFKSKTQLPLLMVWREWYDENGDVCDACVLFNSMDYISC
jgi:hypothetical protein